MEFPNFHKWFCIAMHKRKICYLFRYTIQLPEFVFHFLYKVLLKSDHHCPCGANGIQDLKKVLIF